MLVAKQISGDYSYQEQPVTYRKRSRAAKKGYAQEKLMIVGCVCLALITGLMLIATHSQITQKNDNIFQIKQEISDLQNSNERLKLEIARLKSLDRIEAIATTELGMIQPGFNDIQYIAFNEQDGTENVASAGSAEQQNQAAVEVKTGEKIHPALLAVNKIIANYVLHIRRLETEL